MTTRSPVIPRAALARRSIEVLLRAQAPSGALIAAETFPQYRFAWLRDGSFIAHALDAVGESEAAGRFHDWAARVIRAGAAGVERAIAADPTGPALDPADYLHCRYTVDGAPGPEDWPTFQLDGPGIWLWSLGRHLAAGGTLTDERLEAARLASRYLAALWSLPSYDAWEESPEHVHTSTLGAISAGLRESVRFDPAPPVEVAAAHEACLARLLGSADGDGAFTKWQSSDRVDASLLWLSTPYRVVDVARFRPTLERIERDLVSVDGGVYRYLDDTFYGGGEWILLTASLGSVYAVRGDPGDRERADRTLRWIEARATPEGWLPEQVATRAQDPTRIDEWRRLWGESATPLAWSHAMYLLLLRDLGELPR